MNTSDLEQELADSLAEEISKSIDFEIISDIMVSVSGYTRIDINYSQDKRWDDVKEWVAVTCTGDAQEHAGIWIFELPEDAMMFKLRWS